MKIIDLSAQGWRIKLTPEFGACILNCRYEDFDIMRPAVADWNKTHDPMLTSYFPLVPYSNRIGDGQFIWEGEVINLKPNHFAHRLPLHGMGWLSSWDVMSSSQSNCIFEYHHKPDAWPWPFKATQEVIIDSSKLCITLTLENTGMQNMPAGLGFHPYFPAHDKTRLKFKCNKVWLTDTDQLPKILAEIPEEWDFSETRLLQGTSVDHCFTGFDGNASVYFDQTGYHFRISSGKNLDHCVFYAPENGDHFCIEPVNHMNNALASQHLEGAKPMPMLKPGEIAHAVMCIHVSRR